MTKDGERKEGKNPTNHINKDNYIVIKRRGAKDKRRMKRRRKRRRRKFTVKNGCDRPEK